METRGKTWMGYRDLAVLTQDLGFRTGVLIRCNWVQDLTLRYNFRKRQAEITQGDKDFRPGCLNLGGLSRPGGIGIQDLGFRAWAQMADVAEKGGHSLKRMKGMGNESVTYLMNLFMKNGCGSLFI